MLAVSLGILGLLVVQASREDLFTSLANQRKDWIELVVGGAFTLLAVVISFVRWFFLVRAVGLRFSLVDAFRLGFLGYLFNFVSPGNVGGDLFKAVFIAREQPGRRAEAVATVVVDRVIGLYGLFLVASASILTFRLWNVPDPTVRLLTQITLAATLVGGLMVLMLLVPGFTQGAISEMLAGLPKVGPTIQALIGAVRMFRRQLGVLAMTVAMSFVVHTCVTLGVYFVGRALPSWNWPSLVDHFLIVPLAMVAGAIPLLPMGLGAFEGAMDFLYVHMPEGAHVVAGQGLLVAFVYRLYTFAIAGLGLPFWLARRRELAEVAEMLEASETTTLAQR